MANYVENAGTVKKQSLDKVNFLKKFSCLDCDKKFSKEEELMNHQQIIHGKNSEYDCKQCNKYFSNMEDMRTHLQREHSYKKNR